MATLELLHSKLSLGKLVQAARNAVHGVFRANRNVYVRSTGNMLYDQRLRRLGKPKDRALCSLIGLGWSF